MWTRLIGFLIVGGVAYTGYDYVRAGLFSRPDMPEGAFSISYKDGFRAILVDVPNERDTRTYRGFSLDVPDYLEREWSLCMPPSEEEAAEILATHGDNPGERVEVVCTIDTDGVFVTRGYITSMPEL